MNEMALPTIPSTPEKIDDSQMKIDDVKKPVFGQPMWNPTFKPPAQQTSINKFQNLPAWLQRRIQEEENE